MSPRWKKVIRDLASNKSRTAMVVLAIAVGVFAFGSIFVTREVMLADMDSQYRAVNASSITLSISAFDDDLVRWAGRQDGVTGAQGRSTFMTKLVQNGSFRNLDLYCYDDYDDLHMNIVT